MFWKKNSKKEKASESKINLISVDIPSSNEEILIRLEQSIRDKNEQDAGQYIALLKDRLTKESFNESLQDTLTGLITNSIDTSDNELLKLSVNILKDNCFESSINIILSDVFYELILKLANAENNDQSSVAIDAIKFVVPAAKCWQNAELDHIEYVFEQSLYAILNTKEDFAAKFANIIFRPYVNIIDVAFKIIEIHKKNMLTDWREQDSGNSFLHLAIENHVPGWVLERILPYYTNPKNLLNEAGQNPLEYGLASGKIGIEQFLLLIESGKLKIKAEYLELVNKNLSYPSAGEIFKKRKSNFEHIKKAFNAYGISDSLSEDEQKNDELEKELYAQQILDFVVYNPDTLFSSNKFNPTKDYAKAFEILQFIVQQKQYFAKGSGPDLILRLIQSTENLLLESAIEDSQLVEDPSLYESHPIVQSIKLEKPSIFDALCAHARVGALMEIFRLKIEIDGETFTNLYQYILTNLQKEDASLGLYAIAVSITTYSFNQELFSEIDPITYYLKYKEVPLVITKPYDHFAGKKMGFLKQEFSDTGHEIKKEEKKLGEEIIREHFLSKEARLHKQDLVEAGCVLFSKLGFDPKSAMISDIMWKYFRHNENCLEYIVGKRFFKKEYQEYSQEVVSIFIAQKAILKAILHGLTQEQNQIGYELLSDNQTLTGDIFKIRAEYHHLPEKFKFGFMNLFDMHYLPEDLA